MRVLHVSSTMGGGVASSVLAMVAATPDLDHHLLARGRAAHHTRDEWSDHFTTVQPLTKHPVSAMGRLRRSVRDLFPDVVHAHSSFAGALVRSAGLTGPRIIYSPHCFAFERRDVGGFERRLFREVERRLAPRTDLLVAVAPHEVDLAVGLGHTNVAYVVNRPVSQPAGRAGYAAPLRVVTVGRVSPQKDWRYFLHVKRYAESQLGVAATWEWLGGGSAEGERELADAGVRVSGWLPREEVLHRLRGAQVYLHTAAWEAAPLAVLEAAALGMPLAVRAIPALRSLGLPGAATSVALLAERIAELRSADHWADAQRESDALARHHGRETQAWQLRGAYARACGDTERAGVLTELPAARVDDHLDLAPVAVGGGTR